MGLKSWFHQKNRKRRNKKMALDYNNIDFKSDLVRKNFYIELANKLEEMYNKSTTSGEVTLIGDLILLLNEKLQESEIGEDN